MKQIIYYIIQKNDTSEDIEYISVMTPKSSNISYKSSYKKDKSIESIDFTPFNI